MRRPLHKEAQDASKKPSSHAGLWFDRFFDQYDDNWKVKDKENDNGKTKWINGAAGTVGDSAMLTSYDSRQQALVQSLQGKALVLATDWHFVTGMGNNHPVENGFAWHPTLGVPYLTGAAVKGLLRAWCEAWLGWRVSEKERKDFPEKQDDPRLLQWFGDTDQAGALIFFDAVPTNPVKLKADIMTPHYKDWYAKGNEKPKPDGSNVPADWHDPIPVPFLVVDKGASFRFCIAKRATQKAKDIDLSEVMAQLEEALKWLGAGAKTAAGYGRMKPDEAAQKQADASMQKAQQEKERQALAAAEAERAQQEAAERGYVGLAYDICQQAVEESWANNKNMFMQSAQAHLPAIQGLDAGDEKQQAVQLLIKYLEAHDQGIMSNPNKTQGKKNKPVYKDAPRKMALALKEMQ